MRLLRPWATAILLSVSIAPAAYADLPPQWKAYVDKYHFPVREISLEGHAGMPLPGREGAARYFLPVTAASHAEFMRIATENGAVLRLTGDPTHVPMAVSPTQSITNWAGLGGAVAEPGGGGRYLALELTRAGTDYFTQNRATAQACAGAGNCMKWLYYGKVDPTTNIAHALGVTSSRDTANLFNKLTHAGNAGVIVGVPVQDQGGGQHAANLTALQAQAAQHEAKLPELEMQIAQLEAHTAEGRAKALEAKVGPLREQIEKLATLIREREAAQPQVAAALKVKKEQIERRVVELTREHDAPYLERVAQLDQAITASGAKVHAARASMEQQLGAGEERIVAATRAAEALVSVEHTEAQAPHGHELHELAQAVAAAEQQMEKAGERFEEKRVLWSKKLEQAHARVAAVLAQPPHPGAGVLSHADHLAELDKQIGALQGKLERDPLHASVPSWILQLRDVKARRATLAALPPQGDRQAYDVRIAQLDAQIAEDEKKIPQSRDWELSVEMGRRIKGAIEKLGPGRYDTAFDERLTEAERGVFEAQVGLHSLKVKRELQISGMEQQLAQLRKERDILAEGRPLSEYERELARIDALIVQHSRPLTRQTAWYEPAIHVSNPALVEAQAERARLLAIQPENYHPRYDARMAELEHAIGEKRGRAAGLVAPHLEVQHKALLAEIALDEQLLAALRKAGPGVYDAHLEAKLAGAMQEIAKLRVALDEHRTQLGKAVDAASAELARHEKVKASITRDGAPYYSAAFDEQLAAAQHNDAAWNELLAKGPRNAATANEGELRRLHDLLAQETRTAQDLRGQIATLESAPDAVAQAFAAMSDQTLMGAPPKATARGVIKK